MPPPLRGVDGGFTRESIIARLPAILDETASCLLPSLARAAAGFDASAAPALAAAIAALSSVLRAGAPLPPFAALSDEEAAAGGSGGTAEAAAAWACAGGTCLEAPWFHVELAVYRLLSEACAAATPALRVPLGWDVFAEQKARALAAAAAPFDATVAPLLRGAGGGAPDRGEVRALLLRSLWGNRADLSLSAGVVAAPGSGGGAAPAELLADDSAAVLDVLCGAPAALALVADNAGLELASDLALVDALLARGHSVTVHAKALPVFVSDATPADVREHVAWLAARAPAAGARLRAALDAGALTVAAHAAWSAPAPFWALPGDLRAALARAALALVKGDANYRRLLGDRHWPHADAFARVVGAYAPCAIAALRTAKAPLAVGLDAAAAARAAAAQPADWLTAGSRGMVQLAPRAL